MNQLEVQALHHGYNGAEVVRGLDFTLSRGAIGCLLGPSGCGKTTVLRCIAGFEAIRAGSIRLNGILVSGPGAMLPPERRHIGMVFQDYALFPHLPVERNIAFGLHGMPPAQRAARVRELAELAGLAEVLRSYPHELSGGQQQRVALARALAPRPELLLLDEPFSNLDVALRERLSLEVREIIKASGATAVLVTHDQHEAFAMADEIGVMHEGRIVSVGQRLQPVPPPANRFVSDFVGQACSCSAKVLNSRHVETSSARGGDVPNACQIGCDACGKGCLTDILLRPDDVMHDDAAPTQAEVVHKAFRGAEILYTLRLDSGRKVLAMVPSHHNHALGERIGIRLDVDHVVAFQPEP